MYDIINVFISVLYYRLNSDVFTGSGLPLAITFVKSVGNTNGTLSRLKPYFVLK